MQHWLHILITAACVAFALSSCHQEQKPATSDYRIVSDAGLDSVKQELRQNPNDLKANVAVLAYYTEHRRPQQLLLFAQPVFDRATKQGDVMLRLYSGAYIAQTLLIEQNDPRAGYYLESISTAADSVDDSFIKLMVHNVAGIYALSFKADYPMALRHFKAAYDVSKAKNNLHNMCSLLCNIASIYYMRNDTTGMSYAREAYEIARRTHSSYARFLSSFELAHMFEVKKDYRQALQLTREAEHFTQGEATAQVEVFTLYGSIYTALRQFNMAQRYFNESMQLLEADSTIPWESTYLGYGNLLYQQGRYEQAMRAFSTGYKRQGKLCELRYRHQFLRQLAATAGALGDDHAALSYMKQYQEMVDTLFNAPKEKRFYELISENERISLQNEVQRKELQLMASHRRNLITAGILTFVVVLLIVGTLVYRKQNKLYRKLVASHQAMLKAQKEEAEAQQAQSKTATATRQADSSEERDKALWNQLNRLMDEQHIYREKDISLARIAELLGTNRTYASNVLNTFSGDNFYTFIHKRRIKDASEMLADSSVSLKEMAYSLGYNSLSSFYRAFQKEVGCTPSKYREVAQQIK